MRIITDTNIWYNITQKEFEKIKSKKHKLFIPIIVLNEIYTSPNIYLNAKTFNKAKKAIENILKYENNVEFIDLNPFEYLLKQIMPDYKTPNTIEFYIKEFKALAQLNFDDVKYNHIERFDISGLTNFINEQSKEYKLLINKNKETKKNFKKFSTKKLTENLILKYANENLQEVNNNFPKIDKLEEENKLLLLVFDNLLREVSKSGKKIKNNDWVDIFNLVYVGKSDLYWTKEKNKQKLIVETKSEKHLYENNYS